MSVCAPVEETRLRWCMKCDNVHITLPTHVILMRERHTHMHHFQSEGMMRFVKPLLVSLQGKT